MRANDDRLIEAMARAIWRDRETRNHPRTVRLRWDEGTETARRYCLLDAQAALTAYRNATADDGK